MQSTGIDSRDSLLATMACTMISFLTMMPTKLSGLLFVEILGRYNTDRATASYPLLLCMLVRCSGGPLTGYFGERFGLHAVILTGCILSAVGVAVCFLAEDMTTLIIFLGLVYGLGLTFSMTLFPQVLKQHFSKNLTLAISMSMFGACFGGFIFPPLIKWIFQKYGVSGTFLIMGGIVLNSLPFAMLLKFLKPKKGLARAKLKEAKATLKKPENPVTVPTTAATDKWEQKNIQGKEEYCVWELRVTSNNKLISYLNSRKVNGEKLAKHFTLENGCQSDSNHLKHLVKNQDLRNGKDTQEQTVTLLPKSIEFTPLNNICRTGLNHAESDLVKYQDSANDLNNHKKHLEKDQDFRNDKDALEQTVTLLPKSVKSDSTNPDKKISTDTKPVEQKSVSKQKAALQSLSIFLDFTFLIMLVTQSLEVVFQMLTVTTMLDYSRDKGIDRSYEVYFLMALPLAEVFGRVFLSMIIDRDYITKLNFTIVSFNALAAGVLVMVWAKTFAVMMIGVVTFGLMTSGLLSVFPMMVFQFMKPKNYIMALASRSFLYGPLSFLCGPLIGHFRGNGGSYDWVYYIQAILSVFCAILTMFTPHCAKRRDRKEEEKQERAKVNSSINA